MLTDTSMEVVLDLLFLSLNKIDINFEIAGFIWKKYSSTKALPNTS